MGWFKIEEGLLFVLFIIVCFHGCFAVSGNDQRKQEEEARIFWSSLGDIIEAMPFLPVTINVPDMISSMGSMMSSVYDYFFGGGGGGGGGGAAGGDESGSSTMTGETTVVADSVAIDSASATASRLLLNELFRELGTEVGHLLENLR